MSSFDYGTNLMMQFDDRDINTHDSPVVNHATDFETPATAATETAELSHIQRFIGTLSSGTLSSSQHISSSALQGVQYQITEGTRYWTDLSFESDLSATEWKTWSKRSYIYGSRLVGTGEGLHREDYAHPNDSGLTIGAINTMKGPKGYPRATPPASDSGTENSEVSILTLPAEIRLRIYEFLLVGRPQAYVFPAILRTCKIIYNEGNPVLYSQNIFGFSSPTEILEFAARIGSTNLKEMTSIRISLHCLRPSWTCLLANLVEKANGLRCLELNFSPTSEKEEYIKLIRLGKIRGLKKLKISGYSDEDLLAPLADEAGIPVERIETGLATDLGNLGAITIPVERRKEERRRNWQTLDLGDFDKEEEVWSSFLRDPSPTVGYVNEKGMRGGLFHWISSKSLGMHRCSNTTLFYADSKFNPWFNPIDQSPNDLESAWIRRDKPSECTCPFCVWRW